MEILIAVAILYAIILMRSKAKLNKIKRRGLIRRGRR